MGRALTLLGLLLPPHAMGLQTRSGYDENARIDQFLYNNHGTDWAQLGCTGARQSPIDFPGGAPWGQFDSPETKNAMLPDEKFVYFGYSAASSGEKVKFQNDGHSLALNFAGKGYGGLHFNGGYYNLISMNVHTLSEHTFKNHHFPAELHFVHKKSDADAVIVVAVPVTTAALPDGCVQDQECRVTGDDETEETDVAKTLTGPLPNPGDVQDRDPFEVKPVLDQGTFFEYSGAFTVPNCQESVVWLVKREPLVLPAKVIGGLQNTIYDSNGGVGNFKTPSALSDRAIYLRKASFDPVPHPENSLALKRPHRDINTPLEGETDAREAAALATQIDVKAAGIMHRLKKASAAALDELPADIRQAYENGASGRGRDGGLDAADQAHLDELAEQMAQAAVENVMQQ